MGIISDAIDALEDWCKDLFKDGIQSQFDGISDLLTDTFSQTTGTGGSGGLVNDFVTQHPSQFTGGGTKEHDTLMRLRSQGITDDMLEALAKGEITINTNSEEETNESKIF